MADGYTRQSIAEIVPGQTVRAGPINAELNALAAAFNAANGHAHDGTTGQGPKIDLTTSVENFLPQEHGGVNGRNNVTATTDPTISNDATQGYAPGSVWINNQTGRVFVCRTNSVNTAVWNTLISASASSGTINAEGLRITNLAPGTGSTDAATRGQVDTIAGSVTTATQKAQEATDAAQEAQDVLTAFETKFTISTQAPDDAVGNDGDVWYRIA